MSETVSPLHPEILPRLDPEYTAFDNEHLADKPELHKIPWSPSIRNAPAQPGGPEPVPVGRIRDIDLGTCKARVFNFYLPNASDYKEWDASPIFAPEQSCKGVPNAWIAVCELDIPRDEGLKYGEILRRYGKKVDVKVYEGSPHPIMANDQVRTLYT
jgi:acetyl esterase/lipase